jgi:hypothetical protein
MGLDQYAYSAARAGQWDDYHAEWDRSERLVPKPRELAYWRKHPNLHGWFHQLWNEKGNSGSFNGDELELNWDDLDRLEQAVKNSELPDTSGFFFGRDADVEYRDRDLEFVRLARADMFLGLRVFYNSSW